MTVMTRILDTCEQRALLQANSQADTRCMCVQAATLKIIHAPCGDDEFVMVDGKETVDQEEVFHLEKVTKAIYTNPHTRSTSIYRMQQLVGENVDQEHGVD